MEGRKTVLALDFNNVLFMSYYTKPLINSKGINVNAIKGFFFKLKSFKDIFEPDYIVCASDLSRELTFRRKMFPAYKAQRKPVDRDALEQMKYAGQLFALLGFQTINDSLYEADDVLGMISRLAEDNGMDCVIVSSDRDLYQLVTDHTFILTPRTNDLITKKYMMDEYQLTPDQWIELKALQGDRGDNVPGINGIGNITALQLMQTYDNIENIYNHLDDLQSKVRMNLINGKNDIPLMIDLVKIITDYKKLDLKVESLQRTIPFEYEVFELVRELEIHSLENLMRFELLPQYNDKIEVFGRND